jgi:hypothetical protein
MQMRFIAGGPAGATSKCLVPDAALEQIFRNGVAYSCSDFKQALLAVVFILFCDVCLRVRAAMCF